MVRHKTRWLFIQVDFSSENTVVSKGELLSSIRENILRCGGDTAYSYVNEIQSKRKQDIVSFCVLLFLEFLTARPRQSGF